MYMLLNNKKFGEKVSKNNYINVIVDMDNVNVFLVMTFGIEYHLVVYSQKKQ